MKRAVLVGAVAFLTSCTPDIEQDPSDDLITVEFNPAAEVPVVPTPNDLALQGERLVIPCAPGTTPETDAQCELNQNYLTGLDGYPMESTATALTSAPIDPATVNAGTVIVLDLGVYSTPPSAPTPVTTAAPTTNERGVVVPAPAGGWLRSHRYAVAIVGGANGVKGVDGQQVAGSAAFALIRQEGSLVTGEGCNFPTETEACVPATSLITSTARDINEQFEENRESALQLEGLRRGYKPLLDGLAAIGIARPDVASLWTFRITRRAEVTFDPANSVIPFPNDLLRTAEGRVNLPVPANASPTLQALIGGLNSLDGFSTTAPAISESGDAAGALVQGA
ncbi:MAG TPA: hypothetical protein VEY30_08125, partial [Myxococcaceae bacterium]|nr:hypothetical protein [Myxococcaceae bacterium]